MISYVYPVIMPTLMGAFTPSHPTCSFFLDQRIKRFRVIVCRKCEPKGKGKRASERDTVSSIHIVCTSLSRQLRHLINPDVRDPRVPFRALQFQHRYVGDNTAEFVGPLHGTYNKGCTDT
jgi:hypothetical protein